MPSKKLRGTESRNMSTPSLSQAMGLPTNQRVGTPTDPHDYLKKNLLRNNTKESGKSPRSWNEGYDVKTKITIPSAKEAGANTRTMKRMAAK